MTASGSMVTDKHAYYVILASSTKLGNNMTSFFQFSLAFHSDGDSFLRQIFKVGRTVCF